MENRKVLKTSYLTVSFSQFKSVEFRDMGPSINDVTQNINHPPPHALFCCFCKVCKKS